MAAAAAVPGRCGAGWLGRLSRARGAPSVVSSCDCAFWGLPVDISKYVGSDVLRKFQDALDHIPGLLGPGRLLRLCVFN